MKATDSRTVKRIEVGAEGRVLQPQVRCPNCGVWGDVDADQLGGSVSLICPECDWHGYFDPRSSDEPA